MLAAEVVIEERQAECGAVIFDPLAVRIRQASEAAIEHPNGEITMLDVACTHELFVRVAVDAGFDNSLAHAWRVADVRGLIRRSGR